MKTIETIFKMLDLQLFGGSIEQPQQGTYGVSGVNITLDDGGTHNIVGTNDLSPEMKTFYNTELLENTGANLVFNQFAKKQSLSKRNGKTVEWRRFRTFEKALTPLTEGVIPTGHKMDVDSITATIRQYGDYVPISDVLDFAAVDPVLAEAVKENANQAGLTLDTLTRDVVCAGTNIIRGGTASTIAGIDITDKITGALVAKAATFLKKQNAKKWGNDYVAIIHPSVTEDLRNDNGWLTAHEYAAPEEIFNGEVGKLHGVRFVESTEAKIEGKHTFTVKTAISDTASTTLAVKEAISADDATALAGAVIYIGGTKNSIASATAGAAGSASLTLGTAITVAADTECIVPAKYDCIFFGADAWGTVDPTDGMGLRSIIKPASVIGGPLEQFSTAGWKVGHAAKILYQERMVNLIVGSSYGLVDDNN